MMQKKRKQKKRRKKEKDRCGLTPDEQFANDDGLDAELRPGGHVEAHRLGRDELDTQLGGIVADVLVDVRRGTDVALGVGAVRPVDTVRSAVTVLVGDGVPELVTGGLHGVPAEPPVVLLAGNYMHLGQPGQEHVGAATLHRQVRGGALTLRNLATDGDHESAVAAYGVAVLHVQVSGLFEVLGSILGGVG